MLVPRESCRIFVYVHPVDMRKAIDGLSALVVSELQALPSNGDMFIFRNKRSNKTKLLVYDRNGFVLFYKRLDKGAFKFPKQISSDTIIITNEQLDWLLMGFDFMLSRTSMSVMPSHYF